MITIKENNNITLIKATVTDFSDSLGYCEHKIPFYLEGIKAVPSLETLQGTAAHQAEEEYEQEHFEFEPITSEQLDDMSRNVEFARETLFTRYLLPLNMGNKKALVLLYGRSDKIFRNKETLIVQDDKFPTNLQKYDTRIEPYDDHILQALTYLNSMYSNDGSFNPDDWFEIPHKTKAWIIQIRDKTNGNKPYKIFKGIQNNEANEFLKSSVNRFAYLILGLEKRMHHNQAEKCKPCRYFDNCGFRIE